MHAVAKNPLLVELKTLKSRMDALYGRSFPGPDPGPSPDAPPGDVTWHPPVDIWETEEDWLVAADLPGVEERDMQVQIEGSRVVISGSRVTLGPTRDVSISLAERPEGVFRRSFLIPEGSPEEEIEAELRGGVLTIRIPKRSHATGPAHKIEVHSE